MRDAVCFAAMIPASFAACSGSPFFTAPDRISRSASGFIMISPVATASRSVTALSPTSTIRTSPRGPTCVKPVGRALSGPAPWSGLVPARTRPPDEGRRRGRPLPATLVSLRKIEGQAFEGDRQIDALELHVCRHLQRTRREVEDRFDAGRDDLVDDRLCVRRRHCDDADVEPIAPRDLLQVPDVVDGNAASGSLTDLLVRGIEQRRDLEAFLPETRIVRKRQTQIAGAHDC